MKGGGNDDGVLSHVRSSLSFQSVVEGSGYLSWVVVRPCFHSSFVLVFVEDRGFVFQPSLVFGRFWTYNSVSDVDDDGGGGDRFLRRRWGFGPDITNGRRRKFDRLVTTRFSELVAFLGSRRV